MGRDLTELLLNDQNSFLAEVTSEIAQRVGVAAAQQDALAQFGTLQPEMMKPEKQGELREAIQRVASEHPEFGGNPYQILQQVHENSLALAAEQKAEAQRAERQQEAQSLADARREDSDAKQESDLNFAQYLMDESVRRAKTTGQFVEGYTGLETGLKSLPRTPEPDDAEFEKEIAERNWNAFGRDQAKAAQQGRDALKLAAEGQRRQKRGERPLTDEEANQFVQRQR